MLCPICEHENQPDAKFCAHCGTELTVTCSVCAAPSPAGANFCSNCGANLAAAPALAAPAVPEDDALERLIPPEMLNKLRSARSGRAMAGERRTVTMLFADIKGSTAAAEQLDPEDWAEVMHVAFPRLIEPIYRYEGTLAQLLGDAVLAFFGAPIAHDDDPIRAVRAGLDIIDGMAECQATIQERYGVPIQVRVGINTGLVVVGEVGSDLRVEYTALGDAINVAARMEQTAEPGTIQVSDRTLALTHGAFEAVSLGPVEVKGKSEPIPTFRPTAFLGAAGGDVDRHDFVGRDEEVGAILELVDRLQAGSGWVAAVIGEAGLGKSALLRECENRATSAMTIARHPWDDGTFAAMTGASQSYDASRPMSGFRDVLDRWFALDGIDDYARISDATSAVEFPDVAALIAHAAGAELPAEDQAFIDALPPPVLLQRVRAAAPAYVSAEAKRRPLMIVFEDLHWSDDLTIDLISDLLATTDSAPVGILLSMRPYRDDPSWRVHEKAARDHAHRYHEIQLSPLGESAATALISAMVGDVDERSMETIIERSAGNPLFLEEIATSLGGGGTIGGVPDSLAGVLAARLDRLDEQSRLVAQVSSVLGTEFRRDTVSALVSGVDVAGTITDLLRQGVFIESRSAPGKLQFRHALLQDAAYSSVLLKTRRTLHAEVAEHLAEVAPEGAPEIAGHFVAAGDYRRAFPFLVEAGAQATRAMALADAIRDFRAALDNAPDDADDDLVQQAHLGLGEAYALLPDLSESAAAFQRLFEYGEKTERPTAQVAALNQLGFTTATAGGDTVAANEYLRQARALAEEIGDERGLIEYHMNACMVAAFDGDPATAAGHDAQTTALGAAIGDDRIRVEGLRRRSMNQALVLELEQAEASMALATAAANQLGSAQAAAELEVFGRGIIETVRGRYREAIAAVEPQLPILERFASFDLPMSHGLLAEAHWELGAPEMALASFMEARRAGREGGQPFTEAVGNAGMAASYALLGDSAQARSQLDETRIGEGPMGDYFASTSWYYIGIAHQLSGDAAAAVDAFTRGIAAPAVVQYVDRPRLLIGLTLALIDIGELDRAGTILAEAREFNVEKHLDPTDPGLTLASGALSAALGDIDEARELLTEAIEVADARDHAWVAFRASWALAPITGSFDDVHERAETMASEIVDPGLAASFRSLWLVRAISTP